MPDSAPRALPATSKRGRRARASAGGAARSALLTCVLVACSAGERGGAPRAHAGAGTGTGEAGGARAPVFVNDGAPPTERIATLSVSENATTGALTVISVGEFTGDPRGGSALKRGPNGFGYGAPTHRWLLRGAGGAVVQKGDLFVRRSVEAPPAPGFPEAIHQKTDAAFSVWAPYPTAGQRLEVVGLDAAGNEPPAGSVARVVWP